MSITTKKGDDGISRFWGKGISKDSRIMEAMGNIDELNAVIGLVRCELGGTKNEEIKRIQKNLIGLSGSIVCQSEWDEIGEELQFLEDRIVKMESEMPIVRHFITYGENKIEANFQMARAICRRSERSIVALTKDQKIDKNVLKYINRLSDYLYLEAMEQIKN